MQFWGTLAIARRFVGKPRRSARAGDRRRPLRILILALAPVLLLAGAGEVMADSPPNLTSDIPWNAGVSGVADVEAAFNYGRRQEEVQLGLSAGKLGNLDLPSQAAWDATANWAKALLIMNAERTSRAGMKPGVLGLPFAGHEVHVDNLAQYYANYLVANNKTGHTADGRTPFQRIADDPVLGPCHEFLSRAENLAYFWTSESSNPLSIERAIYNWVYDDADSSWGHREAVLLQDKPLGGSASGGFKNNVGSAADEGYIGIGLTSSSSYDPMGLGWVNMGTAVVLNMIDPISTGACPWDGQPPPSISSITPNSGPNTGPIQITNLAGSGFDDGASAKLSKAGKADIWATNLQVVSASKITCTFNLAGATPGAWDVVVTNRDDASATLPGGFRVTTPGPGPSYSTYLPTIMRPLVRETTVRLGALADTTVLSGNPDSYFGAEQSMWTGYDPDGCWGHKKARSLLVFDPSSIPQGATIVRATLHLEQILACHVAPTDRIIAAYRIASWWDPNAVTWNSQPAQAGSYGQATVRSGDFRRHSMDVTGLVSGWVNGSIPNWGLMLRGPEATGGEATVIGFATRQYREGQFAAELEVTYRSSSVAVDETAERTGFGPEPEAAPVGTATGDLAEPMR